MTVSETRIFQKIAPVLLLAACAVSVPGCQSKDPGSTTGGAAVKASAAGLTTSGASSPKSAAPRPPGVFSIPVGPKLGVFPGQGVGPVRFGATLQTVERLMEAPCTEKTETLCRYAAHAVDFHFKEGAVVKIQIFGEERPFGSGAEHNYGIFNGQFPQGAALGMYSHIVTGILGEPQRSEKVTGGATVERHYYPNFVLEYDRLKNGNVTLASIILEKATGAQPGAGQPAK